MTGDDVSGGVSRPIDGDRDSCFHSDLVPF